MSVRRSGGSARCRRARLPQGRDPNERIEPCGRCASDHRQNVVGVGLEIDLRQRVGDPAFLVDHVRDARREVRVGRTVEPAERLLGVAQQGEVVAELLGESLVLLDGVEAGSQNLDVLRFKILDSITESIALDRSTRGIGLRVEPQDHLATPEPGQCDGRAVVRRDREIRRFVAYLQHGRLLSADELAERMLDELHVRFDSRHGPHDMDRERISRNRRRSFPRSGASALTAGRANGRAS